MENNRRKNYGRQTSRFFGNASPTLSHPDDRSTDSGSDAAGSQAQPLRPANMNSYGSQQPSRQTPRLQNSQKTGLGNGNAGSGWAFGSPLSSSPFGGLGAAPGLGQARPSQLSGFAQVMGGGSGQAPIDMSDFPTLAGSSRPQQASGGGWNFRQPGQQQQTQQPPISQQQARAPSTAPSHQSVEQLDGQRSQVPSSERNANNNGEEFPPLGGQLNGQQPKQITGFNGFTALGGDGQPTGLPTMDELRERFEAEIARDPGKALRNLAQPPPGLPGLSRAATASSQSSGTKSKPWSEFTEEEKWGIAGLNKMLETSHALQTGGEVDESLPHDMRNTVALNMGHDLNDLGMDLNSSEPLYKTFHPFPDRAHAGGPFDTRARKPIPEYHIPQAYLVTNVPELEGRIPSLNDEALFMVFYQYPNDVKQQLAAIELTRREWRWHSVIRQWLHHDTREVNTGANVIDHATDIPIGVQPIQINEHSEKGVYVFMHAGHRVWQRERREFHLVYSELENRFNDGFVGPIGGAPFAAPVLSSNK